MDDKEKQERDRVLEVAHSWLRTPYHHMGRVKGAGVDCLTLLAEVFHEADLVKRVEVPHYPIDWMHHRDDERYMEGLLQYTHEVEQPLPGDIVLWKIGRSFSHGAIVVSWPTIIHAQIKSTVTLADAEAMQDLASRPRKFFSYWGR